VLKIVSHSNASLHYLVNNVRMKTSVPYAESVVLKEELVTVHCLLILTDYFLVNLKKIMKGSQMGFPEPDKSLIAMDHRQQSSLGKDEKKSRLDSRRSCVKRRLLLLLLLLPFYYGRFLSEIKPD